MNQIVLISCVSMKLATRAKVSEIYISPLFKKALRYARSLNPKAIYILSAKYGVLSLDEEIDPYNETLNGMPVAHIRAWSAKVKEQLAEITDLKEDYFLLLAGANYRRFLEPEITNYASPVSHMGIGRQLGWYDIKHKQNEE